MRPFDWGLDWLHLGPPIAARAVPTSAATDPSGAIGSWVNDVSSMLSVAYRRRVPPDTYSASLGFRVVCEAEAA